MAPPPTPLINAQAVSGITGSISIACWIIVFAPQIYENFARHSSDGLSLLFVVLWLLGDIFNVIGAIMQGVLPTMIILAIYYTLADLVLLWQCLYYGDGSKALEVDPIHLSPANPLCTENEPLLETVLSNDHHHHPHQVDMNSATQIIMDVNEDEDDEEADDYSSTTSIEQSDLTYNLIMVSLVIIAGFGGWYFGDSGSADAPAPPKNDADYLNDFNPVAQIFGWLCAFLYLGSRVPQILLNYERKSCEGISFLFFLFACLGNITYVVSILAVCTGKNYLLVNSSWLVGSFGTLGEDFIIFCQFFIYNKDKEVLEYYEEIEDSDVNENTPLV